LIFFYFPFFFLVIGLNPSLGPPLFSKRRFPQENCPFLAFLSPFSSSDIPLMPGGFQKKRPFFPPPHTLFFFSFPPLRVPPHDRLVYRSSNPSEAFMAKLSRFCYLRFPPPWYTSGAAGPPLAPPFFFQPPRKIRFLVAFVLPSTLPFSSPARCGGHESSFSALPSFPPSLSFLPSGFPGESAPFLCFYLSIVDFPFFFCSSLFPFASRAARFF